MNYEEAKARTIAALADPNVGDCYQEMLSYWAWVVRVTARDVCWMDANPDAMWPITLPKDGCLHRATRAGFRRHFSYSTRAGAWVLLHRRGTNVDGWYKVGMRNKRKAVAITAAEMEAK